MTRIIDLSLRLRPGMRGVEIAGKYLLERDGWNASTLHLYTHAGTHMDCPQHFGAGPETIDQVPLESCMGPAWIARLPDTRAKDLITIADLGDIADRFQEGDSLLLNTGWSRFVDEPRYRDELPRVSVELAQWCVQRKMRILGVEPPSVADVHNLKEVSEIHHILLKAGIVIVEGLANLEEVKGERVTFIALPLRIADGDGSPVRAIALEEDR
jgi:kynurenine formamidase